MKKTTITLLLFMATMAAGLHPAPAQTATAPDASATVPDASATVPDVSTSGKWYLGLTGGPSFGQATFRSITKSQTHAGTQAGIFGGYRFSRLLSVEALATLDGQKQTALDCCPYWLTTDGQRTLAPLIDREGHYYRDLEAKTSWMRFGL